MRNPSRPLLSFLCASMFVCGAQTAFATPLATSTPISFGSETVRTADFSSASLDTLAFTPGNDRDNNSEFALDNLPTSKAPEPPSLALLGTGVLGLAGIFRRRLMA